MALRSFPGRMPVSRVFAANGSAFIAVAETGRGASRNDRRALSTIITSLRFPRLRVGEVTGDERFYVLKATNAYPLGSITRIDPRGAGLLPFYLFHDDGGFRAIGSQPFPCDIRFDRAHGQFLCPGGGRWDSAGNVIADPRGATGIEPLEAYLTTTAQGHLLVSESVGYVAGCAPPLVSSDRACPNYQPDASSSRTS